MPFFRTVFSSGSVLAFRFFVPYRFRTVPFLRAVFSSRTVLTYRTVFFVFGDGLCRFVGLFFCGGRTLLEETARRASS